MTKADIFKVYRTEIRAIRKKITKKYFFEIVFFIQEIGRKTIKHRRLKQ